MSRKDIIKKLKQLNPQLNQSEIEIIITTFCEEIKSALNLGKFVFFRNFGTFMKRQVKEKYSARNPKTGEIIYVPKKNKIRFKASKKLEKLLNQ